MPPTGVRCSASPPEVSFSAELEPEPAPAARGALPPAQPPVPLFGNRFSAWLIDACLLFSVQWIVVIVLARQLQAAGMVDRGPCVADSAFLCEGPNNALWAIIFVIVLATTFGYHAWFDGVVGATPGKRWLGLRVVDAAAHRVPTPVGGLRGLLRSIVRQGVWLWVFLFVAASPISIDAPAAVWFGLFALSLSTLVWGALVPSGRAWHDLAADTVVVPADSPEPPPSPPIVPPEDTNDR